MSKTENIKFDTLSVHAGMEPDPTTGSVMTPIYQTSTYVQEAPGKHTGFEYARSQNPTRFALERAVAELEGGKFGLAAASGMAAVDMVTRLLNPGDEVISTNDLYGGSYRAFTKVIQRYGVKFHFVDMTELAEIQSKINDNTRMIWIETPSNPLLNITDISGVAQMGEGKNIIVVADNTFATPYLQRPLDFGADIVMHSATKYIGGHSDVVIGAIITNNQELYDQMQFVQNTMGGIPGPNDCFLALRGAKTLALRMRAHCKNANAVANFLNEHPKVGGVHYPGLPGHKNHEIAKKQMRDFGGMVSFFTKNDSVEEAEKIMTSLKVFTLAESLGGVESLAGHPATMTHAAIPKEERYAAGLRDSFIRLSVGIEDEEDLLKDLAQALDKI